MAKSRVPVATGPKKVTPKPVLHGFIIEHKDGGIRSTCRCNWKAPAQTFRYEDARAEFEAHKMAEEAAALADVGRPQTEGAAK